MILTVLLSMQNPLENAFGQDDISLPLSKSVDSSLDVENDPQSPRELEIFETGVGEIEDTGSHLSKIYMLEMKRKITKGRPILLSIAETGEYYTVIGYDDELAEWKVLTPKNEPSILKYSYLEPYWKNLNLTVIKKVDDSCVLFKSLKG